ncbi:hypothetical protein H8S33_07220 [Ornithinibacillus sp. BX22]|uniref:DUF2178 domain-containing protein n=1 Tax=Ornithinibacillus hominis TaxID=2763055 RepID=A0A923L515_9BACI|nr:hypothetical protein [Ornithinibacillus hominis]MBC5636613.1 hypothetical protein [Ornithinibacillus hominis]
MLGELENPWVIIMLLGTFIWLLIAYLIQRRIRKQAHYYDERNQYETNRAKAKSWDIMFIIMIISIPIVLIVEGVSFSYFFLMGVFFLHTLSVGGSALYYHFKNS